jgi:hypothetical protein
MENPCKCDEKNDIGDMEIYEVECDIDLLPCVRILMCCEGCNETATAIATLSDLRFPNDD